MALAAGRRSSLGFILFVPLFMAADAVFMQRFHVVFKFKLFHLVFFEFFGAPFLFNVLGHFAGLFVACHAGLDVVAFLEIGQGLPLVIVMAVAAAGAVVGNMLLVIKRDDALGVFERLVVHLDDVGHLGAGLQACDQEHTGDPHQSEREKQ
jgi:hypothetical protein